MKLGDTLEYLDMLEMHTITAILHIELVWRAGGALLHL